MLTVFCLLFLLGLGHCQDNDLPTRAEVEKSINRTIEEVERQVRADPSLPRLNRHDIVGILRNITSRELDVYNDKNQLERARNLYQRALMVVLPYNVEESSGNLKDLYTKPPMTQMIGDYLKTGTTEGDTINRENNVEQPTTSVTTTTKDPTTMKNRYKNHRDTYSEVRTKAPLKETLKLDATPVRFSFNLENLQKSGHNAENTTTSRYPVYKNNQDLEIVYNRTAADQSTAKPATKEITIDLQKPKESQNVLLSSQWRYNAPPSTTLKPTLPSKLDKIPFLPTINAESEVRPVAQKLEISKGNLQLENAIDRTTKKQTTLYVTPMPTDGSPKAKYSSTYSMNSAGFRQATITTSAPVRPEVMGLLDSIGLKPENSANVEDVYKKHEDILRSKAPVLELNSIRGPISISPGNDSASIANQNTFKSPGSEIRKGVENLTPDVQLLFQTFGLQTSLLDQSTTTTTRKPALNLNSYTNFKPLPTSNVKDAEFKEFLAKFGLGVGENRRQKSLKGSTEQPSLVEAVPNNMRGILENIGLISNSKNRTRMRSTTVQDMESTETSKFHVFKPHEVRVQDEEQRNKINELLDTVKLVQEGKADAGSVKKAAKDLLETTRTLRDGPDPLKLEEIIKSYDENYRNEVKRQEETMSATTPPRTMTLRTTRTTTTTTTASTAEETPPLFASAGTESAETRLGDPVTDSVRAGDEQVTAVTGASPVDLSATTAASDLAALEESFGGTTKAPDPVLPPKRKSGLYFLVDWNTFLEVGEDDKEKVNLRFQPKVGDRSRFLPVTVP